MKYPVEIWGAHDCPNILDVLKHVVDFGVAIAWIEIRKFTGTLPKWQGKDIIDIGLVMPYCEKDNEWQYTHRTFNKMLFSLSKTDTFDGITVYDTPISPYVPGDGGLIELKDCLYVPPNFSSIAGQ